MHFWQKRPLTGNAAGILLVGALLITSIGVREAQAAEPMTWEKCVAEAKLRNPEVLGARARWDQARSGVASSQSPLYPQISAGAGLRRSQALGADSTDSWSYDLSGQWLLFDGMKTWNEISQATLELRAAEMDYANVSSEVRLNLRESFVALLKTRALMALSETIVKRRQANVKLVELRYNAGREHRGSRLLAQAQLAQAQADGKAAERSWLQAQCRLNQQLGRNLFDPLEVAGSMPEIEGSPIAPDYRSLTEKNPTTIKWQAQVAAAQAALNSAYGDFFPTLNANGSLGRSDTEWPLQHEQWSAGLSLNWQLFAGGRRWAALTRANANVSLVEAQAFSAQQAVGLSLVQGWTELENARDDWKVQKLFLQAAQERSRIAEAQYSTGLLVFDSWIIIEDNYVQTEKSMLASQAQALNAEAVWIASQGGTLENEK